MSNANLARRYRRLLVTYPRAYRKARGEEIVDTMLDVAGNGQTRPTTREAFNLVASGLRARLGRPRSRVVVALSVCTALMAGLLGSAVGYRVAWQAVAGPLPTNAEAHRIVDTTVSGRVLWTQRDDFVFGWWGYRHSLLGELALWSVSTDAVSGVGDADTYGPGEVDLQVARRTPAPVAVAARDAQRRLRANGWTVMCSPDGGPGPCRQTGTDQDPLVARRGDVELVLSFERGRVETPGLDVGGDGSRHWVQSANGPMLGVHANYYRATTPLLVPVGQIAAGLLAAVLAWLAFGWLSRRTERRRGADVAYGFLVLSTLPSAVSAARATAYTIVTGTPDVWGPWGPSPAPIRAILDFDYLLDFVGLPALLILLAMALRPRRPATPTADPASG